MTIREYLLKVGRLTLGDEFFYNNIGEIRDVTQDCRTFLDVGCGSNSPYVKYLRKSGHQALGLDLFATPAKGDYEAIIRSDALDYLATLPDASVDAVLALDVVEHYNRAHSEQLLHHVERIAKRAVVVVTPNGFWPGITQGPGMEHLCGWTASDLNARGYRVWGSGGASFLRSSKTSMLKGLPFKNMLARIFHGSP